MFLKSSQSCALKRVDTRLAWPASKNSRRYIARCMQGQVGSERSSAASLRGGGALSLWAVRQTSASTTKRRILRRSSSWSARSEDDALHVCKLAQKIACTK
eukprot:1000976-Pelagomonas_calceolata.AAC.7